MFRKNGIDVTDVISSQGGGTTLRNMLAGGIPFADAAAGATVAGIRAGLPVKVVGTAVNNAADNAWVVLANSSIKSLKEMVGRKFGTTNPGGVTRVFGEMLLKHNGIEPMPGHAGAARRRRRHRGDRQRCGGRDLCPGAAVQQVRRQIPENRRHLRCAAESSQQLLITSQELIDKQPDKLRALLLTHKQAVDWIYANPKEATSLAMKRMVNIDEPALLRAVETDGAGAILFGRQLRSGGDRGHAQAARSDRRHQRQF